MCKAQLDDLVHHNTTVRMQVQHCWLHSLACCGGALVMDQFSASVSISIAARDISCSCHRLCDRQEHANGHSQPYTAVWLFGVLYTATEELHKEPLNGNFAHDDRR